MSIDTIADRLQRVTGGLRRAQKVIAALSAQIAVTSNELAEALPRLADATDRR